MAVVHVRRPPTYTIRDDSSTQHEPVEVGDQSRSSVGSPSHTLSPLPAETRYGGLFPTKGLRLLATLSGNSMEAVPQEVVGDSYFRGDVPAHHVTVLSHSSADFSRAWSGPAASSDGYEASSGESVEDGDFLYRERVSIDLVTSSIEERRKVASIRNRSLGGHGLLTSSRIEGDGGADYAINDNPGDRYHWLDPSASPSSLSNDKPSSDYVPDNLSPSQRSTLIDASPGVQSSSRNLIYSGTSIFYGGPMAQTPIAKGENQGLPPKPPMKTGFTNPTAAPELKPPVRVTLRSQSPVFAPRAMLPFSLLRSPKN